MIEAWFSSSLMTASSAVRSASNRPACQAPAGRIVAVGDSAELAVMRWRGTGQQASGGLAARRLCKISTGQRTVLTLASKHEGYRIVSSVP